MTGRIYTCEFENIAVTTAVDIFEFDAAAEKPIELIGLFLRVTSEVVSNVGRDEFLRFRIVRGNTTSGSGGAATTPRPMKTTDAAAGFACEANNTTAASAGTAVNLHSDAFNVRVGYDFWWPEMAEPDTAGTVLLVVRLMAAPSESINLNGTAYIREFG